MIRWKDHKGNWWQFRAKRYLQGHQNKAEEYRAKVQDAVKASYESGNRKKPEIKPEVLARRNAAVAQSKIGTHGFGRAARDNPNHALAKEWEIRSPRGEYFRIKNLQSWCRQNEHRFHDDRPESKMPLWKRAYGGLREMQRKDRPTCSWHGWTLVASEQFERDVFGIPNAPSLPPATSGTTESL